jgi:N-acetylmuramoyl-L-alanine amidase
MTTDFQSLVTILDNARYHSGEFKENPTYIIMHTTEGASFASSMEWLNRPNNPHPASYHYGIERKSSIIRMTNPKLVAWHSGDSKWPNPIEATEENPKPNKSSVNHKAIGIAWANDPGPEPLTIFQQAAGLWLCKVYCNRFNIPSSNVLGHLEVSPGRKFDPDCIDMKNWRKRLAEYLGE